MFLKKEEIIKIEQVLVNSINPYLIFLFGSAIKGRLREDSDIDIAFLSDKKIDKYKLFKISLDLADVINRKVDLVNLNEVSTVFKAQVVATGKVIYCADEKRRMYFMMRALKDYAKLNEERDVVIEKIKQRGRIYG